MVKELAADVHLPWFKQAYKLYAKGKRFADDIPGREKYAPLTLTNRGQKYKLTDLAHNTTKDPNRLLTQKMRQAGTTLDTFKYMIPRNREEYLRKHPEAAHIPPALPPPPPAAAPKSIAVQIANASLAPPPANGLPLISSAPPSQTSIPATQEPSQTRATDDDEMTFEEDEEIDPTENVTANGWGWGWY